MNKQGEKESPGTKPPFKSVDPDLFFRSILDQTENVVFVKDRDGKYLFVNRKFEEVHEMDSDQVRGKTDNDIFPEELAEKIRKNDRKVIRDRRRMTFEEKVPHPDGLHTVISDKFPLFDDGGRLYAVAGVSTDVTLHSSLEKELRSANRLLKANEQQLRGALSEMKKRDLETRAMLGSMINAFVLFESVFDPKGTFISYRFVYINRAYEKITGVKNQDVRGKTVHEVWPETEPEWIRRYGSVAMTGKSREFELYHDPTKKLYHCQVYRPYGHNRNFCVIFEDVTEGRKAESALRNSEQRLRAIFDTPPFPLAVVDIHDNQIHFWSKSAEILFGHTAETAEKWYEIAYPDPDYRRQVVERWKPVVKKAEQSSEAVYAG